MSRGPWAALVLCGSLTALALVALRVMCVSGKCGLGLRVVGPWLSDWARLGILPVLSPSSPGYLAVARHGSSPLTSKVVHSDLPAALGLIALAAMRLTCSYSLLETPFTPAP